jgi:hypothetical protein
MGGRVGIGVHEIIPMKALADGPAYFPYLLVD